MSLWVQGGRGGGSVPIVPFDTATNTPNQVIYTGAAIPANSTTEINATLFVKKHGTADGGKVDMAGVWIRHGTAAPVRVPIPCPCAGGSTTVTKVLDNVAGNGASGTPPTNWSGSYTAAGGACIIRWNATGYTNSGPLYVLANLKVDGVVVASTKLYHGPAQHLSFPAGEFQTTLSAGAHTIAVTLSGTGASGDANDVCTLIVEEDVTSGAAGDPVSYALSGATLDGTTSNFNITGPDGNGDYFPQVRVSPESAETLHWGTRWLQTPFSTTG